MIIFGGTQEERGYEVPKSSGPPIRRDVWQMIRVSLTQTFKKSKGRVLGIHEA
jgi:hypothetical protein